MKGSYGRMIVMLGGVLLTAFLLQSAFDASDHKKAEHAVRSYRVDTGPSLGERVEKAAPGGVWSSEITNGCRGIVRVTYSAPGGEYAFEYDVPAHGIHPGSPSAQQILASLPPPRRAPPPAPAPDGAHPSAPK